MNLVPALPRLSLLLFAACALSACGKPAADDAGKSKPATEVGVVVVAPSMQPLTTELPGRTTARMIAEIRPQVSGIIQKRLFVEGASVKAGETLYQIDPAVYRAAYASAEAGLEKSEATLKSVAVKAGRYAELVKINAVSKQEADDIQASLQQAQADVALAKAALETARINLYYTRITAPISGRVETSAVTPGALVTANQTTALTTVQQLDPIYVDVTQPSNEVLKLKHSFAEGKLKRLSKDEAKIAVILEDGSRYPLTGRLKFSGVTVNPTSGSVTLRAVVPNPEGLLMPGMYVRAQLEEAVDDAAILIPQQSVLRNGRGEAMVLLANTDNKVEQRMVAIGRAVGNQWLVENGLQQGDRVIVEGLQKIRPGDTVKPVQQAGTATSDNAAASGE